jgi:methyl-accepting chemotaxis protein
MAVVAAAMAAIVALGIQELVRQANLPPEALRAWFTSTLLVLLAAVSLIFLLAGYGAWVFTRKILARPLNRMAAMLKEMGSGQADLTRRLAVRTGDETEDLSASFNGFLDSMEKLVASVLRTAGTVTTTSEQLAASTEEMSASQQEISATVQRISQGSTTQVASVAETRAAVEEISSSASAVNDSAQASAQAAGQALQLASEGGANMIAIVGQMGKIDATMGRLAEVVASLEGKAGEIGRITELISAVAWRTNLLALNAAIEAARAGESGRGFAVVAEEVKKLAERTAGATKEIESLVKRIQEETAQTVKAMGEGVAEVASGKELAGQSNQAFSQIIDAIKHTDESATQISQVTGHQVEGVKKIAGAIEQVAGVAQETASGMEETAAAQQQQMASMEEMTALAQELAQAAGGLKQLVESFKIRQQAEQG